MFHPSRTRVAATVVALLWSGTVQVRAQPPRPDPLDPQAAVPAAAHNSALGSYRRGAEVTLGSWKAANETVNRIGGWRTYAREAPPPDPARGAPTRPPPAPGADADRQPSGALR
jgi:hypothetical protein